MLDVRVTCTRVCHVTDVCACVQTERTVFHGKELTDYQGRT
jgi:hypothetical protein